MGDKSHDLVDVETGVHWVYKACSIVYRIVDCAWIGWRLTFDADVSLEVIISPCRGHELVTACVI